ncbi:MAG TPA: hypothetical protein VF633_02755 [Brevundimonas sp.]|jgi:chromosome segregation ATPase
MGARLLFLVSLIATGVGTAMPDTAGAQTVALTPEQMSAFNQQVVHARQAQTVVGKSEACVTLYNDGLQRRSSQLETALADNLRLERALDVELIRLNEERGQFSSIALAEQRNLDEKQRDLQSAIAERQEQDRRLQECRRAMTFLAFLCDWGDQAVRDLGWMRNVQAEIGGIEARLESRRNGMLDAERRLAASHTALTEAERQIAASQKAIPQIEAQIVQVKATIADLHVMIQSYNTLLDDFASLLEHADAVTAGSPRAREIIRLSSNIEDLVSRSPAAVSAASAILPEDLKQACSTH